MEKYRDGSYTTSQRAADFLARMRLEEKVAQLCGDLPASFVGPAYMRDVPEHAA